MVKNCILLLILNTIHTNGRRNDLNKYSNSKICALPGAQELKSSLIAGEGAEIRKQLSLLFDENTFVETAAFTKRAFSDFVATEGSNELAGVITGYGAINGKLVFAFAEDVLRMGGVIDEAHAKKIYSLYNLAISNGAPVIGIFDSCGTDIFAGTGGLSAYGKILSCVNKARGVIPQIAYVTGKCIGTAATIAATFDVVVKEENASLYVTSPAHTGATDAQDSIIAFSSDEIGCAGYIRNLVDFLPDNSTREIYVSDTSDSLNRLLGDLDFGGEALTAISAVVDNGVYHELGHNNVPSVSTVLASIGGVKCGIVATSYICNEGKITKDAAKKISRFVNFLNRFSLPVVTLVDSLGLAIDKENEMSFADELARLASAYASADVPKVTVITGHAIGASFVLLGSKALGADLVYTLDNSEIGALSASSGVAFAWDKLITEEHSREEYIAEWKATVSSPANACASGEIDDIISTNELRARICSALLMLSSKGICNTISQRRVLPL